MGSALIQSVIDELKKSCSAIDLEVEGDHRRAERLYKRIGFEMLKKSRWVKHLNQLA